jgi:hypothetical protein
MHPLGPVRREQIRRLKHLNSHKTSKDSRLHRRRLVLADLVVFTNWLLGNVDYSRSMPITCIHLAEKTSGYVNSASTKPSMDNRLGP